MFGVADHLIGRALFQNDAVFHEKNPVGHLPCEFHEVRNDDHRHALIGEDFHRVQNFAG